MRKRYELVFAGGLPPVRGLRRYRRYHPSIESAQAEADRLFPLIEAIRHPDGGAIWASVTPVIYGPGPGEDMHAVCWPPK